MEQDWVVVSVPYVLFVLNIAQPGWREDVRHRDRAQRRNFSDLWRPAIQVHVHVVTATVEVQSNMQANVEIEITSGSFDQNPIHYV